MKVKEALSDDYKKDEESLIKTLKENEEYVLKETNYNLGEEFIPYSIYRLYDKTNNKCIITLGSPDPNKNEIARDLYLKYQVGCKEFMINYFDLLAEKISGFVGYHTKDRDYKLFTKKVDSLKQVIIGNKKGDEITDIIGVISLTTMDDSEKLAIKIVDYFENFKFTVME